MEIVKNKKFRSGTITRQIILLQNPLQTLTLYFFDNNNYNNYILDLLCRSPLSPNKWLSPHTCRRLFGRPQTKAEKRAINYKFESTSNINEGMSSLKDKEKASTNKNFSILQPLMQNYHVLRHPAIQKELEERAAAEARILSDETCNTIEKSHIRPEQQDGYTDTVVLNKEKCLSDKLSEASEMEVIITNNFPTEEKNDIETNHDCNAHLDTKVCENIIDTNNKSVEAEKQNKLISHNIVQSSLIPTGSIEVRKCYIPGLNAESSITPMKKDSTEVEACDQYHMKCFRTQPGTKEVARLEKQEKVRKLATLALFGHTFRRPEIVGIGPHAVAVNGFKRYHLKLLSKSNNDMPESNSDVSYSGLKAMSKKNRKSKFPRICLSGKTASDLLARSPQCTESSDSSDDDSCCNNNTQKLSQRVQLNSKDNKGSKSMKSKSLISSLSKSKKSNTCEEEEEFPCHYCDRTFTTKSGLGWHESYSHPRTCRVCAKSFQFSNRWSRHKDPICNNCSEKYPQPKGSPIKLTPTLSQNYNPQQLTEKQKLYYRFKCDICNKLFGKRSRMINHITNVHPADMHKVDLAKFVFSPKKVSSVGGRCYTGGYGNTARKCTPAGSMEQ